MQIIHPSCVYTADTYGDDVLQRCSLSAGTAGAHRSLAEDTDRTPYFSAISVGPRATNVRLFLKNKQRKMLPCNIISVFFPLLNFGIALWQKASLSIRSPVVWLIWVGIDQKRLAYSRTVVTGWTNLSEAGWFECIIETLNNFVSCCKTEGFNITNKEKQHHIFGI